MWDLYSNACHVTKVWKLKGYADENNYKDLLRVGFVTSNRMLSKESCIILFQKRSHNSNILLISLFKESMTRNASEISDNNIIRQQYYIQ